MLFRDDALYRPDLPIVHNARVGNKYVVGNVVGNCLELLAGIGLAVEDDSAELAARSHRSHLHSNKEERSQWIALTSPCTISRR